LYGCAELKKLGDASQQLSNLDVAGLASEAQCSALFATVADAKLRLAGLQKQVNAQHRNRSLCNCVCRRCPDMPCCYSTAVVCMQSGIMRVEL
jgi:hypothetical protein